MRDGVRLYTEVFLPKSKGAGEAPAILVRSPYPYTRPSRNDTLPVGRYLDAGYAFAFQLARGQERSEGEFHFMRDEGEDGYDAVEWIAAQSWCNGRVGMQGASYAGHAQLYAARLRPPSLKCIMPTGFVGDFLRSFPFAGGVPLRGLFMQWCKVADAESLADLDAPYGDMRVLEHETWGPALRHRPLIEAANGILEGDKLAAWREVFQHPFEDEYWSPLHLSDEDIAQIDIPIFVTDGWLDATIGPLAFFERLERLRPGAEQYLLVGPWNHLQTYAAHRHKADNGLRAMPVNAPQDLVAQRLAFFDRYLKGDGRATVQEGRVRLYITGANEWRTSATYPLKEAAQKAFYLHSSGNACVQSGSLNETPPRDEAPDCYTYDPEVPIHYEPATYIDCRSLEIRSDVLTYTSEPLQAPLTLMGEISLVLHAASDAPDTDWFALVTEVFPDGRSVPFHGTLGSLRARYREGMEREKLLQSGAPTRFDISLGPAGHQLAAGQRLRLSIFSSAFPTYDLNTNTGADPMTDTCCRPAHQTVFHDAGRKSRLILSVIDA